MDDRQLEDLLRQLKAEPPSLREEVVERTIRRVADRPLRWVAFLSLLLNAGTLMAAAGWLLASVKMRTLLEAGVVLYGALTAGSLIVLLFVWDHLAPALRPRKTICQTGGKQR